MSINPPLSARRRAARVHSGQALFSAFASTIRLLRWLLLGLFGFYLCSGITIVGPNEDALIYRFGTLQREVHPPGLLLALPPPMDRVVRLPTRTQHEIFLIGWSGDEDSMAQANAMAHAATAIQNLNAAPTNVFPPPEFTGSGSVTIAPPPDVGLHPLYNGYSITGDVNLVQARFTVRYRISDPLAFISATDFDSAWRVVEANVFDAATIIMAGTKIDDALGAGLESFRSQVRVAAQDRMDQLHLGVELVAFEVNLITPPQAAAAAFADVTSAQVEARTVVEKARTFRAQTLPAALSDSFRIRSQAEAEALQRTTKATAEAGSFNTLLVEYRAAPELVRSRLHAEALEAFFPLVKTTTIVPGRDGTIDLFLPSSP